MNEALTLAYRFKPLRTAAQVLAGFTPVGAIWDVDWSVGLGTAASAGLATFLHLLAEGGDFFADDKRVTGTKSDQPASED